MLPAHLKSLITEIRKLPSIGPKSAQRLALYLLQRPAEDNAKLAELIHTAKDHVHFCTRCFHFADNGLELCEICRDKNRDASLLCVVAKPFDLIAIEKTNIYKGFYHVLGGTLNPVNGIGPKSLHVQELVDRLQNNSNIKEVVIATNPDIEGDATALYLEKLLEKLNVKTTRLGRGMPTGGDLEYADEVTIKAALESRK